MFTYRRILMVTVGLLGLAWALPDPPTVEIVNPPRIFNEQDPQRFQVRVPQDDQNRLLVFAAVDTSDGLEVRRSEEQLDGAQAPRTRWFTWRLGHGELVLIAALYGVHGQRGKAVVPVYVQGRLGSDP